MNLGKAVPPSQEVASLLYQLEEASNLRDVSFNSIVSGASGSSSSAATSTTAAAAATSSGFTQMPFTFDFSGGFFALEHLFRQLTAFTTHRGANGLRVSGRLLTIQSVKLSPEGGSESHTQTLTGTVDRDGLRAPRRPNSRTARPRPLRRRPGEQLHQLPDNPGCGQGDPVNDFFASVKAD